MPERNKKLAGFEALYQVDQEKQHRVAETADANRSALNQTEKSEQSGSGKGSNKTDKSESNIVSNITVKPAGDVFEPTTFKTDRRKVKALKRLALDLEPARKLQDLFDEALSDILAKYGQTIE